MEGKKSTALHPQSRVGQPRLASVGSNDHINHPKSINRKTVLVLSKLWQQRILVWVLPAVALASGAQIGLLR